MRMEILITNQAEEKLNEILDYVISNFGILVATNFVEKVENTLKLIENNYTIGKRYKNNYYSLLVIKEISVYYKVSGETIYIMTYFNNRQNPKRLNQLLS